jgi:hypothetical protein
MTYNLKINHKAVKFIYANRSTDIVLNATSVYADSQYPLTTLGGSTGVQAALSGGDIVLGSKVYHGVFYPFTGGDDQFSMRIFINGSPLSTQRTINKPGNSLVPSALTRSLPLFFSYTASAGDVLSIRYSKNPSAIYNIYSVSYGTNIFLMEVDK